MTEIQPAEEIRWQVQNPDIPDEVDGIPLELATGNHIRQFFEIIDDNDGCSSASGTRMFFSENPLPFADLPEWEIL